MYCSESEYCASGLGRQGMTTFAIQYFHECHIGNACRHRLSCLIYLVQQGECWKLLKTWFQFWFLRAITNDCRPMHRALLCSLQSLSRVRQRAVKMRLLDDGAFSRPIVASKKYREMAEKCTTQTYHQFRLRRPGMMGLPVIIYLGSIIS